MTGVNQTKWIATIALNESTTVICLPSSLLVCHPKADAHPGTSSCFSLGALKEYDKLLAQSVMTVN